MAGTARPVTMRPGLIAGPPGRDGKDGAPGTPGAPGAAGPAGAAGVIQSIAGVSQASISQADLTNILISLFDALPWLPVDPSTYPAAGGLFRDGNASGYRLVRIFPAS